MTNIFSIVRKNTFTKKFLSWFLALSVILQTVALPIVASAHDDVNNHPEKVKICHIPTGNPENAQTIEVDDDLVAAHLSNGDTIGECPTPPVTPPPTPTPQPLSIVASKIVCDDAAKLPNWGLGGPDITATTAADYAAAHPGCALTPDWKFQWGFGQKSGDFGVNDFPGDFVGEANGASALGLATGGAYNEWKTFGPTTPNGVVTTQIADLEGASNIWVREVLQDGYIPFTFDDAHQSNANNVSAEMYCSTDVLNYDNYDSIGQPELGKTYYCVAFNAKKVVTPPPPVVPTSTPSCVQDIVSDTTDHVDGGAFAVATYAAHPNWTAHIPGATWIWKTFFVANPGIDEVTHFTKDFVVSGAVASATMTISADNSYSFSINGTPIGGDNTEYNYRAENQHTFNVTTNLHAGTNTLTFEVKNWGMTGASPEANPAGLLYKLHIGFANNNCVPPPPAVNTKPVITVQSPNPMSLVLGGVFSDPGATAFDLEDGTITPSIIATGTVNMNVVGTYTITYNVNDSQGLAADTKTRTVLVQARPPQCSDGIDNDHDGKIDFVGGDTGCDTPTDNDENNKPIITVITPNPTIILLGSIFTDLGANATDTEDCIGLIQSACNTALHLTATGTVNTSILGTSTITYNATDSQGLAADPKIRTVVVQATPPQCSDGIDNDHDGKIDFVGGDTGCDTPTDNSENTPPVIALIGSASVDVFINTTFTEPGANATDTEDCRTLVQAACNNALHLTATGTVNTSVLGTYTITYNATDSQNLAAVPVSRTVHVLPNTPSCTVNCGGGSENARPVITLIGGTPLDVVVGTTFTDPGATEADPEDGDITAHIVATGGPVTTTSVGNFTLSYDVSDSHGLAAVQVRRDVHVVPAPITGCVTNCGGGGGGGGPIGLSIFNERIVTTGTTTVTVTWNTNQPADSRVVYGLDHVASLGNAPLYGYPLTTATDTTMTTNHSMIINGIPSAIATYFRPLSSDGAHNVVGIELTHASVVPVPQECFYLREYLRLGANNNPAEVTKLQTFLHNNEGFTNLPVTGFFDTATDQAVRTFQDRYKKDVLDFWNLPSNTGYVYFTTQKKVNELYCKREFPLDRTQMDEITSFRDLIKRVNAINAQGGVAPTLPLVGINLPEGGNGSIAGASTVRGGEIASGAATVVVATPTRMLHHGFKLGDFLALSPNLGGLSGTETATRTPNLEVAAVGSLPEKKGFSFGSLLASIVSHIVSVFK